MIGQIVFNSGRLGANRNVAGKLGMKLAISTFMLNGISSPYQLDESISKTRVVG